MIGIVGWTLTINDLKTRVIPHVINYCFMLSLVSLSELLSTNSSDSINMQ